MNPRTEGPRGREPQSSANRGSAILLHICCAPCAIYPVEELRKKGYEVTGYFYNPNIHPYSEYLKRKTEVEKFAEEAGMNVIYGDYDVEEYFRHIVYNEPADKRCPICWWMRLQKTAACAKEGGFDAFTTTLLGSPYQDRDVIKSIGDEVAKKPKPEFYHGEFDQGFREAHRLAKSKGIYCQNYCGCIFSELERLDKGRNRQDEESRPGARTITVSVQGSKKKIACRM